MNTERLTGHLINGIALLKRIRDENAKQNQDIDKFLEELLNDLQQKDKKKEEGEGGEKEEPEEESESDSEKNATDEDKKVEEVKKREKAVKEKKMEEALKSLEEVLKKAKLEEDERLKEKAASLGKSMADVSGEDIEVEDIEITEPVGNGKPPRKVVITEPAKVVPKEEGTPSAVFEAPEVEDRSDPGKVYCAVCEEWHDEHGDVK